jgi:hypothetical protein
MLSTVRSYSLPPAANWSFPNVSFIYSTGSSTQTAFPVLPLKPRFPTNSCCSHKETSDLARNQQKSNKKTALPHTKHSVSCENLRSIIMGITHFSTLTMPTSAKPRSVLDMNVSETKNSTDMTRLNIDSKKAHSPLTKTYSDAMINKILVDAPAS